MPRPAASRARRGSRWRARRRGQRRGRASSVSPRAFRAVSGRDRSTIGCYRDGTPAMRRLPMDHAAFQSWLDRYIDAWRLLDPLAIGDLFSPDVRYAFDPFERGRRRARGGRRGVAGRPRRARLLGGRLRGPRHRRRRLRRPRPDPLPDRRPIGGRPRVRQRLRRAGSTTTAAAASSPSGTCGEGRRPCPTRSRPAARRTVRRRSTLSLFQRSRRSSDPGRHRWPEPSAARSSRRAGPATRNR